jgi:hypothetical protein
MRFWKTLVSEIYPSMSPDQELPNLPGAESENQTLFDELAD